MPAIRVISIAVLLSGSIDCFAQVQGDNLKAAQEKFHGGDFDGALQLLEPLLKANDLDPPLQQRARRLAGRVLESRGSEHFRQGKIEQSIADFDRHIELQPDQAAQHWKRGIAYYYAGKYEQGKKQFELHQTVNPQDVENAVWHFLCSVSAPNGSVKDARKNLIDVTHDARIPMAKIQQMFAGTTTPKDVLQTGNHVGGAAEFYADLYVGLYYDALGRPDDALRHISRAANRPAAKDNYMGDVARVHVMLRKKADAAEKRDNASSARDREQKDIESP